jgi:hypothetical protein
MKLLIMQFPVGIIISLYTLIKNFTLQKERKETLN